MVEKKNSDGVSGITEIQKLDLSIDKTWTLVLNKHDNLRMFTLK